MPVCVRNCAFSTESDEKAGFRFSQTCVSVRRCENSRRNENRPTCERQGFPGPNINILRQINSRLTPPARETLHRCPVLTFYAPRWCCSRPLRSGLYKLPAANPGPLRLSIGLTAVALARSGAVGLPANDAACVAWGVFIGRCGFYREMGKAKFGLQTTRCVLPG
jgi:predicted RNA-binding Zn-ribbon protein involved in translation (DUF1610 family)